MDFVAISDQRDHVHAEDAFDLNEGLPGAGSESASLHPHLKTSLQDKAEEADQDMGLDPVFGMVKHRA